MYKRLVGSDVIIYGSSHPLLTVLGVVCLAGFVVTHVFEYTWQMQAALAVLAVGGILIGLAAHEIRIDFAQRQVMVSRRYAGRVTSRVEAPLERIEGVTVLCGAPMKNGRREDVRTAHRVILSSDIADEPLQIGLFNRREHAMQEAAFIAERIGVRVHVLE